MSRLCYLHTKALIFKSVGKNIFKKAETNQIAKFDNKKENSASKAIYMGKIFLRKNREYCSSKFLGIV